MSATSLERKKWRVAIVNSHPIQYFAPLYASINRSADIEMVPIYLSDISLRGGFDKGFGRAVKWDIDLLAGTDPIFVNNADRHHPTRGLALVCPDIWNIVRRGDFDAMIVHGYVFGANHVAVAAARSKGIPCLVRGETHLGLNRPGLKAKLRTRFVHHFYNLFDGFLAIGTANRDYYRALGYADERIFAFPYTVDNARMEMASDLGDAERAAYRATLGLRPDAPAVLFASKFEPRKHADDLLAACKALVEEGIDVQLVLAGAGEMDSVLRAQAATIPGLTTVFPGFVNQSELPRLFGVCDVFVLPSEEEPWGLIINEAMCAGLPVVVSREIGAVADLVKDGDNGHVFDARDVAGLADALRPIVTDVTTRAEMGSRSREIIRRWSYTEAEAGLRTALAKVTAEKPRRHG